MHVKREKANLGVENGYGGTQDKSNITHIFVIQTLASINEITLKLILTILLFSFGQAHWGQYSFNEISNKECRNILNDISYSLKSDTIKVNEVMTTSRDYEPWSGFAVEYLRNDTLIIVVPEFFKKSNEKERMKIANDFFYDENLFEFHYFLLIFGKYDLIENNPERFKTYPKYSLLRNELE